VEFSEGLPEDFSLLIGDAIHNLRSSLDHATWELIGIDKGTQDRETAFPFSKSPAEYEALCDRIKTPRSDTVKFFRAFEAHPGGLGERFFRLHELDILDKHRALTPILGLTSIEDIKVTQPNGQITTLSYCQFRIGPDNRSWLIGNLNPADRVELDQNSKPTIEIFFGDVKLFEYLPLVETLMDLMYACENVIGQFEDFVASRP
jgi:hypothetical protein